MNGKERGRVASCRRGGPKRTGRGLMSLGAAQDAGPRARRPYAVPTHTRRTIQRSTRGMTDGAKAAVPNFTSIFTSCPLENRVEPWANAQPGPRAGMVGTADPFVMACADGVEGEKGSG